MPLHYDIVPSDQRATIVGEREVTMAGMIAFMDAVAADPRFQPHFTVLLDLRDADYAADLEDGEALVAVLKRKQQKFQGRFAVVVADSLYLLAKLYCVMARMGGFEQIQCFNDLPQARAWCQAPASNSNSNCSK